MRRYHKEVYTKIEHWQKLREVTEKLNLLNWKFTGHCLDNVKFRGLNLAGLLEYIKGIKLEAGAIFEYYLDEETSELIKICYRLPYITGQDLTLVIGNNKQIITLWVNDRADLHYTLNKGLYSQAGKD